MPSNLRESILDATTDAVSEMAIEYGRLARLPKLTDTQGDRIQAILDAACENGALSFWISEIDHILGHEMGLLGPEHRRDYDDKKALLREHFTGLLQEEPADKSPKEIRELLKKYLMKRESSGFDGPFLSDSKYYSGFDDYQQHAQKSGMDKPLSGKHSGDK